LQIQPPDQRLIETGIVGDDKLPGRIGLDHVHLRPGMIAGRERRIVGRLGRVQRARVALHIGRIAKAAVGKNWEHRDVSGTVIRHQHELAGWMNAEVTGPLALRIHFVD
jgi:hypothetical protein